MTEFAEMLRNGAGDSDKFLCAHNGKEFDYPYMCRRMIINGIEIPEALKFREESHGKFAIWIPWSYGSSAIIKTFTSLKLLAKVLGIPSPKDDIDGSMVNSVYWIEKDLDRIVEYCQKDVITLAQVLLRFHCEPLIKPENIEIKSVRKADI